MFQWNNWDQTIHVPPFKSEQVFLMSFPFYLCAITLSEAEVVSQFLNYSAHLYTTKICSGKKVLN